MSYKTTFGKPNEKKAWLIVDAENQSVGRLASRVAYLLHGKHKSSFSPHINSGDHVIVINASKVRFTGKKLTEKVYVRHTGYPGGQRFSSPKNLLRTKPESVIEYSVKKMLPHNRLGRDIFRNLHVYASDKHPHDAQQPTAVDLKFLLRNK